MPTQRYDQAIVTSKISYCTLKPRNKTHSALQQRSLQLHEQSALMSLWLRATKPRKCAPAIAHTQDLTLGTAQLTTAKAVIANVSSNTRAVEYIHMAHTFGLESTKYLYSFFVILRWSHDLENVTLCSVSQDVQRTPLHTRSIRLWLAQEQCWLFGFLSNVKFKFFSFLPQTFLSFPLEQSLKQ